jgi:uncharacterized protein YlxW (UPF0749 family)
MEFDLEMARRNVNQNSHTKDVMNKKEEELMKELNQVHEQCRDKDFEIEKHANELGRVRN